MQLPLYNLGKEVLSDYATAITKEWVVTNGLGGYASSTVLGINTRKYHGLLVSAFNPPGDRRVCLAKLDEEVNVGNRIYPLSANEFQNGVFPKGYMFLESFAATPFPKFFFSVENVRVHKIVFTPNEKNVSVILYRVLNESKNDVEIRVFPLINWRHFHSVTDRWKINWDFVANREAGDEVGVSFSIPRSTLMMTTTEGRYIPTGKWIERIFLREEAARGESCLDDCYEHGYFGVGVKAKETIKFALIAASYKDKSLTQRAIAEMPKSMYDLETLYLREREILSKILTSFYENVSSIPSRDWLCWIALATDMFLVERAHSEGRSVIAGYHWFETWGRDTFISLPGLMLVTGRFEEARRVFLSFKRYVKEGLIPNFLPDQNGLPAYNTVDASLWYIYALLQYLKYTGDIKLIKNHLWETLKSIIEHYEKGTAFNIQMESDGLLSHGPQLTWMDTVVEGDPVTPRAGKAVEIQALWYNSLKTMEMLADALQEKNEAERYGETAEKARRSFIDKFWRSKRNCLFDVVGRNRADDSLRPNQIIAVALDFSMLDTSQGERIVDLVQRELLTPYGLRSLSKTDPRYMGSYTGGRSQRDQAYHNGTAWPWLLGPFTTAYLRTKGSDEHRRQYAFSTFLQPLLTKQIFEGGIGSLSEIYDGSPPHRPRGCIAQAWSVAEPLRAYVEDICHIGPKHKAIVREKMNNV